MPTLTFSDVFYDLTWQDVGDMLSMSEGMESMDCRVTHDTSGGTRSDGTEYATETRITAEYEYQLDQGPPQQFASKLTDIPRLPDNESDVEETVRERAGAGPPPQANAPADAGPPAGKGNGNGKERKAIE